MDLQSVLDTYLLRKIEKQKLGTSSLSEKLHNCMFQKKKVLQKIPTTKKGRKVSLSVTGFEPAISRFVAERVIRCATRMVYKSYLNIRFKSIFKMKGKKIVEYLQIRGSKIF